jgi:hypothetical protein
MRKFALAVVVAAFAPMTSQPSSAAPIPGSEAKAVAPLAEQATFYRRHYDYYYYPRYRYYDYGYYPRYRYYDYGGYYPRRYYRYYDRPYRNYYYRRYWY